MTDLVDVVVIGGGGAGLAAAVQLGRMRRRTVVIDGGRPRNLPAAHMHGYPGFDGVEPSRFLAEVRAEVAGYGVELVAGEVVGIHEASGAGGSGAGFTVALDGRDPIRSRRVLVATGITDLLPDIPGVVENWGRSVIHCPYCHGWEVRGHRLVVIDTTGLGAHQALLFRQLSDDVTLVVHAGPGPDEANREHLDVVGVPVVVQPVARLDIGPDAAAGATADSASRAVVLADGSRLACDSVVVGAPFRPNLGPLGGGLEPALVDHVSGLGQVVQVGPTGATSIVGLYAAGNIVDPSHQVLHAAADGSRVGAFINVDLIHDDLARAASSR